MASSDLLHRFLFEELDVRGELTTLDHSYAQMQENNADLPEPLQRLLGELAAAAVLLSSSLKFNGILTLQAKGSGPVSLMMAECTHHSSVRGIIQCRDGEEMSVPSSRILTDLVKDGVLAITIEPENGERYQGVVPLDKPTLSECLDFYFAQSEQLPTQLWLGCDGTLAAGLLLQSLPRQVTDAETHDEAWERVTTLASTITDEELLGLAHSELLYRLFHQEKVRLFEPASIRFECRCSRERSANTLISLGREDVEQILLEQGAISINCQFCNQSYLFREEDLDSLFGSGDHPLH